MEKIDGPAFFIGKEKGLIPFGAGQPDLLPPKEIYKNLSSLDNYRYEEIQGSQELRQAIAKKYPQSNKDNFIITNGTSEALYMALRVLYKHKAKVLIMKPYYYSYPFYAKYAGMDIKYCNLKDGKIDINIFKKSIKGCRAVIINSPGNPTGRIQSSEVLIKIKEIAEKEDVYIIFDEVYKDIIYINIDYDKLYRHLSSEKIIFVNSFSKTYSMCGYRVGYAYSQNQALINKILQMKTHISMNTNTLAQKMALEAIKTPKSYINKKIEIWRKRKSLIYGGLKNMGLDLWEPEGAFYVFPKVKNPKKMVYDLYYKYKISVFDGAWFGDPRRIRLSFALDDDKIKEGLERIEKYLKIEA